MNYICDHANRCSEKNCDHQKLHNFNENDCSRSYCKFVGANVKCIQLPELVLVDDNDHE